MSHPMWVRGLKPVFSPWAAPMQVAPYVGAWIETVTVFTPSSASSVAPYVGAWIETSVS